MLRSPLLVLVLLLAGCFPRVGASLDGGDEGTGGGGGGAGGGTGATVACFDGQLNGDESDLDCGGSCPPCTGLAACRTALDCASGVCAAGHCAVPAQVCAANFAGCSTFVDLTADATDRTIRFPLGNDAYGPKCARVRFGQTVVIAGNDFTSHPMAQACGPVNGVVTANTGNSLTLVMDKALGVFGYWCTRHGSSSGSGMAAAIEVVR